MKSLQSESDRRRPDRASDNLVSNAEQALWAAHVRAAELVDTEPTPTSRNILNAVHERWRQKFLGGE